jgi:hypothetical protein
MRQVMPRRACRLADAHVSDVRLAGFVPAIALIVLCCAAGHAGAQNKPPELPPADTFVIPDSRAYELKRENRMQILCTARAEVYERLQCEKTCTEECRSIGEALKTCDSAKVLACTR